MKFTFTTKERLFVGLIVILALVGFILGLSWPVKDTTEERIIWVNKIEWPKYSPGQLNDIKAEFGLRDDGVIVWRYVE